MRALIASLRPTNYVYLLIHFIIAGSGFWMMSENGAAMQAVGSSFVATGVTGWVVFVYIFLNEDTQQKFRLLYDAGITQAFTARGSTIKLQYDERLQAAKAKIDLLGFGQRALREDYSGEFATWKTRAFVRILLLDPGYPSKNSYARQRDLEEGAAAGTISGEVNTFLKETGYLRDDRFQVRLYTCLPSISMFRIDNEILWGPYLAKRVSRNSPTFVVRRGGDVFETLRGHFDTIWESDELSKDAPL